MQHSVNKTILVIDNDKYNRIILRKVLKIFSCKLIFTDNIEEAFIICEAKDIDLIIIEIDVWFSYKFIGQIRQTRETPVIALTVCAMTEDRERCYQSGCNLHIAKPYERKILVNEIEKIFKSQNEVLGQN